MRAREKFPISDNWISFHFYLKSRLSESQRQELIRQIRMRQSEKKGRLHARLDREAAVSGGVATGPDTRQTTSQKLDLSKIFNFFEENKETFHIDSYSVSQASLEQVFIQLAKELAT